MPVNPTYPGIYIQELPGPPPTIAAAPTSVTVFIGYSHPYKTQTFGQATEIFSFADYQRSFGGFFSNEWLPSDLPYAVQQFFLNGGADAYVVGMLAKSVTAVVNGNLTPFFSSWSAPTLPAAVPPGSVPQLGSPPQGGPKGVLNISGINIATFSGLEPIDSYNSMDVSVTNLARSAASVIGYDLADLTITYGSQLVGRSSVVETFRRVSVNPLNLDETTANPNFIETRINGNSQLVWVSTPLGGPYPLSYSVSSSPPASPIPPCPVTNLQTSGWPTTTANPDTDFTDTATGPFADNSSLDKVPIFNLMVIPGVSLNAVWSQAIAFCERKRAFLIMDPPYLYTADSTPPPGVTDAPPPAGTFAPPSSPPPSSPPPSPQPPPPIPIGNTIQQYVNLGNVPSSINAALYFPWLVSTDALNPTNTIALPPSGTVAGIFAATDNSRGVWKAPAGFATVVNNVTGVVPTGIVTENQQGVLNPLGVNCLRTFPNIGTVVFGARTTTTANPSLQQWRYVPVRRMALFIEQSLYAALGWVVFEPNDTPLWNAITTSINAFMLTLFHQGAFQGTTASQAFRVTCDSTTTTQTDINNGIVNILVAFAPLKPAEFVVIQIAQLAGQSQS